MKKHILSSLLLLSLMSSVSLAKEGLDSDYNPFKEMQEMQSQIDKIFEKFHKKMLSESMFSKFPSTLTVAPDMDLKELKDSYELKADIPDVDKNEIHIDTEDNLLKIEVKSKKQKSKKSENFLKEERFVGTYIKSITLPKDADVSKLTSSYKDGVLEIIIPKK